MPLSHVKWTKTITLLLKNINALNVAKKENLLVIVKRCFALNSLIVNSGNINIDNFIKGTQSSKNTNINSPFLEWVPYDEFINIEHIGKGGFSQIYKATWKMNGGINYHDGTINRSTTEVVLKVLNDSENLDTEFLEELRHTWKFDT
ncbi:hypothetical protein Glove_346g31 [Diversispora epigaea]|uniref:Protein kinase domain-containing protein n=1 Tax=Diversispora epigaea TaxID=1348612 RepID=A0A397HMQ8_9GLOM|nr:hypothetical protein Glove_346g31 [Diversispora epigaea]